MRSALPKTGAVAVIFASRRNGRDEAGYAAASEAMDTLARAQPGFIGMTSVRDAAGHGVTISYWADEASAVAWRDHPDHAGIRARGRRDWYDDYEVVVAQVTRRYRKT
jgi:heme-degrading monooxygenase HmoA